MATTTLQTLYSVKETNAMEMDHLGVIFWTE